MYVLRCIRQAKLLVFFCVYCITGYIHEHLELNTVTTQLKFHFFAVLLVITCMNK